MTKLHRRKGRVSCRPCDFCGARLSQMKSSTSMMLSEGAAICSDCVAVAHKMLEGAGLMPEVDLVVQRGDGTFIKVT